MAMETLLVAGDDWIRELKETYKYLVHFPHTDPPPVSHERIPPFSL